MQKEKKQRDRARGERKKPTIIRGIRRVEHWKRKKEEEKIRKEE